MQIFFKLGLLVLAVGSHVESPLNDAGPFPSRLGTRIGDRAPLRGRPLCGLDLLLSKQYTTVPTQIGTRGWDQEFEESNSSFTSLISERQMTLPTGDSEPEVAQFLIDEGAKDEVRQLVWGGSVDGIEREVNNARFENIPARSRRQWPFAISVSHLARCTGLMIVSHRGIFGGHYWESIGFNLDVEIQGDLYGTQEEAFQRSILDTLEFGTGGHASLTAAALEIGNDDSIKAFLVIPDTDPEGNPDPYREYWNRMKVKIGQILPKLSNIGDPNRWQEVTYRPVQDEERRYRLDSEGNRVLNDMGQPDCLYDPLHVTSRGRMLCKFDPDHDGKKKMAIWVEDKMHHDDVWE